MSDIAQGTPVGQMPVTGGRERRYANDAERARAWRERQKARRIDALEGGGRDTVTPELAEASLAVLLDRLGEVGRAHEATVGELASRVEDAIGALADPEALAEALAGARAEAARQVAEAEERAIRASQAKAAAEAVSREAAQARTDAEEAANGAWSAPRPSRQNSQRSAKNLRPSARMRRKRSDDTPRSWRRSVLSIPSSSTKPEHWHGTRSPRSAKQLQ
jgi:hypothetical protein